MKANPATVVCVLCVLLLFLAVSPCSVHAQNYVKYKVQINTDASAQWTITQASNLNATVNTWNDFQQKIGALIQDASYVTHRQMNLDPESLQMNTVWGTQSQTTSYEFKWLNFSIAEEGKIAFGDVFEVNNFFGRLYGDGELEVFYPEVYTVEAVSPPPNGDSNTPQALDWLGTQFFANGNPTIVLAQTAPTPTPTTNNNTRPYALLGIGILVVAAVTTGYYLYRRQKHKTVSVSAPQIKVDAPSVMETEEGKILKVLQASGGSAYQSVITEKCRFSKAKTSQLLSELEKRGIVTRYKKGRDKIVSLTEQAEGEKP